MKSALQAVLDVIREKEEFVIAGHERPDGDCIGSEVALCRVLRAMGKSAVVARADDVPPRYLFVLNGASPAADNPEVTVRSTVIALDCATPERLGSVSSVLQRAGTVVNIDHHVSNTRYGDVVWVDPEASSVGEMLWRIFDAGSLPVDSETATGIFVALVTDTGQFSQSNTTPGSLKAASAMVASGADPEAIYSMLYQARSSAGLALEALAIQSLRLDSGGAVASIALSRSDFESVAATPWDSSEFVRIPMQLSGVKVGFFCYEIDGGKNTKASIRTDGSVDADVLAANFGGGGHARASGCIIEGGVDGARERIAEAAVATVAAVS